MARQRSITPVLEFLGTGTSTGVPVPGCGCAVCRSTDPRDKRMRSSVLIRHGKIRVVIDTGPEFRIQCLRASLSSLDAVLLTHDHADHLNGFDDVRAYSFFKDKTLPVYGLPETLAAVRDRFSYIWTPLQAGGGLPDVRLESVNGPFTAAGLTVIPIPLMHGKLPILGYRVGDLAYLTDVSELPDSSLSLLDGLGSMIISCVRYRRHRTHMTLTKVARLHQTLKPKQTLLTHLPHSFSHRELCERAPDGMLPAHDGMRVAIRL